MYNYLEVVKKQFSAVQCCTAWVKRSQSFQCKRYARTYSKELCLHILSSYNEGHRVMCASRVLQHIYSCLFLCDVTYYVFIFVLTTNVCVCVFGCSGQLFGSGISAHLAVCFCLELRGYLPYSNVEGDGRKKGRRRRSWIRLKKGELAEGSETREDDDFIFIKWDENKKIYSETPGDELCLGQTKKEVE